MPRLNPRQISSLAKAVGNTKLSIGVREQKLKELEKLGFDEVEISQGGYKVVTTLDYKTQQKAMHLEELIASEAMNFAPKKPTRKTPKKK